MTFPVAAVKQCFALIASAILLTLTATDSSALECYDCHGVTATGDYRPLDRAIRDPSTGGFQGNHSTHMAEPANPSACEPCHPRSGGYSTGHRDGKIKLSSNINYSPLIALYNNSTSAFRQTTEPALGSCTNVNCHFERGTDKWGSAPLSVPDGCGQCHGSPPNGGETGPSGSHLSHDRYYPGAVGCGQCHADHAKDGSPFSHATSAGRRPLLVQVRDPKGLPSGSYSGGLNDYLPKSQTNLFGNCSNTYCHSNGTSVSTNSVPGNSTPVWGSSAGLSCAGCHATPPSYANLSPKPNAHPRHKYYGFSCSRCHAGTTGDGTTIADPAKHANAAYDVAAPPGENLSYSYNPGGSSCTNSYCHSSAQGINDPTLPPVYSVANWNLKKTPANGSGSGFPDGPVYWPRCDNCHNAGYHRYGMSPPMKSGSHEKHLQFEVGLACNMCHYNPRYPDDNVCGQCHLDFWSHQDNSARGPEHVNGVIDVAIDPNFPSPGASGVYTGDSTPGTTYGSCMTLYCHSQGTRATTPYESANVTDLKWGGPPLPDDCTGCHNGDQASSRPMTTGSHNRHLGYGCPRCHTATVTGNRKTKATESSRSSTFVLPLSDSFTRHANGQVEVAFSNSSAAIGGRYAGLVSPIAKAPGSVAGRCLNTYCHSSGTSAATGALFGNISTPIWGSSRSFACDSCHGNPPAYLDTVPKANGHAQHLAYNCSVCHYGTTTDGSSITNPALHPNGSYDVSAAPGYNFGYISTRANGSSCSNVGCHPLGEPVRAWSATNTYAITVLPTSNGTIAVTAATVKYGADSFCTIQPDPGCGIVDVVVDGKSVGPVTSYTFSNVITNHTITATIKRTYKITASAVVNGAITVSPALVFEGSGSLCTIVPDPGFSVADVLVDNVSVGAVTSYRFSNVTANHTIAATMKRTYTITALPPANGTITVTPATLDPGASSVCTIQAYYGYYVCDVLVDGTSVGAVTSYTFTNVTANHTIAATMKSGVKPQVSGGYYHSSHLRSDGSLLAWGENNLGQLGDGTSIAKTSAVRIGTASDWTAVSSNNHSSLALKKDRTLWAWGYNYYGQLGDGTTVNKTAPVKVGTATDWAAIAVGATHSMALKTDGTLWAWGYNCYGQLGDGTTVSKTAPVKIGTATNWAAIAVSNYFSVAVRKDGTLWAWGYNADGQLGQLSAGSNFYETSPLRIGTATDWAKVAAGYYVTHALKKDGTLWGWGRNSQGQVGDGTTTDRVSPVKIASDTDWASIAVGMGHTLALKSDGTLWAWGQNYQGELGDGTTINKSSPVSVGTDNDWASIAVGAYHSMAIKKDETVWVWGQNYQGQLGDGTTDMKNSPLQLMPTITSVCGGGGTISPAGVFSIVRGTDKLYSIRPNAGYSIADVLVDGVSVGPQTAYTFSNIQENHSIAAGMRKDTDTVGALPVTNGTINCYVSSSPYCLIVPDAGFSVADVRVDNISVGAPTLYNFYDFEKHTIAATMKPTNYTIKTLPMTNGSIAATPKLVAPGAASVCTIVPNPGCSVVDVKVDGVSVGAVSSYTFSSVSANHTIQATFKTDDHAISVTPLPQNGSVSLTRTTVPYGGSSVGTIVPDTGFSIADVRVDGVSVGAVSSYSFNDVSANHTITATFKIATFTITPSIRSYEGTMECSPATVNYGSNSVCTIIPLAGYAVQDLNVDGTLLKLGISTYSYTFSNVTANHTITPIITTARTLSTTSGSGGTVSCSPSLVAYYTKAVCTAVPDAGYALIDMTIDGVSAWPLNSYTFDPVTANHAIAATFAPERTITTIPFEHGTITCAPSPAAYGGNALCTAVPEAGYRIAELSVDGISVGEVGRYTFTNLLTAHTVTATADIGVTPLLVAQDSHALELQGDGTLWAFGANYNGQLGDGTTTSRTTPAQIGDGTNWTSVATGKYHAVAVKRDGTLWGWGDNSLGQLGDGTGVSKRSPSRIGTANDWATVAAGTYHSLAVKKNGTLWGWGYNYGYQLGDGTRLQRMSPVQIGAASDWSAVAAGENHGLALKKDGSLWGWGYNYYYEVGDGTMAAKIFPVRVGSDTNWAAIAAADSQTLALKTDGTLWGWGRNFKGQLGDGTIVDKKVPTKVGSDSDWATVSTGSGIYGALTMGTKTNGTLWAWGSDSYGIVATSTSYKSSPVKIGSDTDWAAVGAGTPFMALKKSGKLWVWGNPSKYYDQNGKSVGP